MMRKCILLFMILYASGCVSPKNTVISTKKMTVLKGVIGNNSVTMYFCVDSLTQKISGKFYYSHSEDKNYYYIQGNIINPSQVEINVLPRDYYLHLESLDNHFIGILKGELTKEMSINGIFESQKISESFTLNPLMEVPTFIVSTYSFTNIISSTNNHSPTFEYINDVFKIKNPYNQQGINKINQQYKQKQQKFSKMVNKEYKNWKNYVKKYPENLSGSQILFNSFHKISYIDTSIISIQQTCYSFMGGAHGTTKIQSYIYRLKDGKLLNKGINELITSIDNPQLLQLLREKLLTQMSNKISKKDSYLSEEDIKSSFFEFNKIRLNNNFIITPQGLIFTYEQYEIAAYAFGMTTIFFDFDEIKPYINKDSDLWYLFEDLKSL